MQLSTNSPIYQKAFEQYLRKGTPIEVSMKALLLKAETATNHHTPRYMWLTSGDEKVRPSHAANDGEIFYWSDPPPTGHPSEDFNCRCVAVPYVDMQDAALLAVGSMIAITPLNRARVLASRVLREGIRRIVRREEAPPAKKPSESAIRASREWKLSKNKSDKKWKNQLEKGNWTPEKITQTIKNGTPYKAVNKTVIPNQEATIYKLGDDFVVVDNKTIEVIQVSRDGFKPPFVD